MASDLDEQRFRWVHPERDAWAGRRWWLGAGAVTSLGVGALLVGTYGQFQSPGPRPDPVECPGNPQCEAALPDWFAALPETDVVEIAAHNRLVRGLVNHREQLDRDMAGRVVVGLIEQSRANAEFEVDGAFTTVDDVLDHLADREGLRLETQEEWTATLPDTRLPVRDRLELPAESEQNR